MGKHKVNGSIVKIDDKFIPSPLSTTLIFDEQGFSEGIRMKVSFKPAILGRLTKDVESGFSTTVFEAMAEKMQKEDFGKEIVKAAEKNYSEREGETHIYKESLKVNILSMCGIMSNEHKGKPGSLEDPWLVTVPYGSREIAYLPAKCVWCDWLAINGSTIDLHDIGMDTVFQRFLLERTRGTEGRKIWLPGE